MKKTFNEKTVASQQFSFQCYGVKIGINSHEPSVLQYIKEKLLYYLPNGFELIENDNADHIFYLNLKSNGSFELQLRQKGMEKIIFPEERGDGLVLFENQLHLTIGNYADTKIFLHAGVVAWNDKAILIPAPGMCGKSRLVTELVKLGALYYSDEYAVLDQKGWVHPFPRMILIRGLTDEFKQTPIPIESIGGEIGKNPIPVGMIVFTKYQPKAKWKPMVLSPSEGIMNLLPNTIPFRQQPKRSLEVLNILVKHSIMIKTNRTDAKKTARLLLEYLEKTVV